MMARPCAVLKKVLEKVVSKSVLEENRRNSNVILTFIMGKELGCFYIYIWIDICALISYLC